MTVRRWQQNTWWSINSTVSSSFLRLSCLSFLRFPSRYYSLRALSYNNFSPQTSFSGPRNLLSLLHSVWGGMEGVLDFPWWSVFLRTQRVFYLLFLKVLMFRLLVNSLSLKYYFILIFVLGPDEPGIVRGKCGYLLDIRVGTGSNVLGRTRF